MGLIGFSFATQKPREERFRPRANYCYGHAVAGCCLIKCLEELQPLQPGTPVFVVLKDAVYLCKLFLAPTCINATNACLSEGNDCCGCGMCRNEAMLFGSD